MLQCITDVAQRLLRGEMIMPPKPKFNREEIVSAGLEIAREFGIDAVKAREVGEKLGCSSRPIFTFFDSMEELQKAVELKVWSVFNSYLDVAEDYVPSFKKRGMQMVKFAQEEPKLFQLLLMSEKAPIDFDNLMRTRVSGFGRDIDAIRSDYGVTQEEANLLFGNMWLSVYGICVMCATKVCAFSESELASMLGRFFAGEIMVIKSGKGSEFDFIPTLKDSPESRKHIAPFTEG